MSDGDVVPLPPHLSDCGCPHAPRIHLPRCVPAIEFDEMRLADRPGYIEGAGQSFAMIGWDYPLRISGTISIEVALDPEAIILAHVEQYHRFQLEDGWQEYEKPVAFLYHLIEDQLDHGGIWFGQRLAQDQSHLDELRARPDWKPEDTERLNARLGQWVDPNQLSMLESPP